MLLAPFLAGRGTPLGREHSPAGQPAPHLHQPQSKWGLANQRLHGPMAFFLVSHGFVVSLSTVTAVAWSPPCREFHLQVSCSH